MVVLYLEQDQTDASVNGRDPMNRFSEVKIKKREKKIN
jgi:hypothetical protein